MPPTKQWISDGKLDKTDKFFSQQIKFCCTSNATKIKHPWKEQTISGTTFSSLFHGIRLHSSMAKYTSCTAEMFKTFNPYKF